MKTKIMNKFFYKTTKKYTASSFILGVILLIGLVSPAFVGASIIVTDTYTEDPNEGWGIIVTDTYTEDPNDSSTTTTISSPYHSSHDDSSTSLAVVSQLPCHDPSCTTTTTYPLCHDPSCTKYTCNANYQCIVDSNGPYTSLSTCQANCQAPVTRYTCNTSTWQCVVNNSGPYTSLNTCQTNCKAPCTRYTCNTNYQCVVDSNGQYTSLGTCQNNCNAPTRYACNTNTYQCYQTTSGAYSNLNDCTTNCQAPVTRYTCNTNYQCVVASNGQYTSLSTCQNNCNAPTRYACNTNTYQCYQTTAGSYISYNDCANACQVPITRYSCNTYTSQCIADNSGPYTSLNTCQNNCITQTRYSCNYSTYQCYQTTSGSYISYNDCANACQQTNQSLSVSCNVSPNPAQINQTVTFSSNVSGGSGNYTYYWSGATYGNSSYSQKSFSSNGNYTAYLTVNDSQNKSASTSCSVNVNDQCTNTGTLSLWADNYTIAQGESTYLRWTSTNTNYCTASNGWTGSKSTNGYESVSPTSNTTYSLTCYGSCGQVTRSITIYTTSVSTNLNLTKLGRNLSTGDRVYSKVVRVTENNVIEFYLTVTTGNNKDLYNVNIKDVMPSVLSYMPGTTKINNIVQPDTITTTGLSLGTLYKGASKTIVFQAISLYPGTYLTYTNTAEVTADNESKITDSASVTYGLVAGAATIRTGPLDTLFISFVISLISALMIWYYLRFNPKGQLALVRTESKIRDIWLAYTRNRIMRQN